MAYDLVVIKTVCIYLNTNGSTEDTMAWKSTPFLCIQLNVPKNGKCSFFGHLFQAVQFFSLDMRLENVFSFENKLKVEQWDL